MDGSHFKRRLQVGLPWEVIVCFAPDSFHFSIRLAHSPVAGLAAPPLRRGSEASPADLRQPQYQASVPKPQSRYAAPPHKKTAHTQQVIDLYICGALGSPALLVGCISLPLELFKFPRILLVRFLNLIKGRSRSSPLPSQSAFSCLAHKLMALQIHQATMTLHLSLVQQTNCAEVYGAPIEHSGLGVILST